MAVMMSPGKMGDDGVLIIVVNDHERCCSYLLVISSLWVDPQLSACDCQDRGYQPLFGLYVQDTMLYHLMGALI